MNYQPPSVADELEKLAELKEKKVITHEQFEAHKKALLGHVEVEKSNKAVSEFSLKKLIHAKPSEIITNLKGMLEKHPIFTLLLMVVGVIFWYITLTVIVFNYIWNQSDLNKKEKKMWSLIIVLIALVIFAISTYSHRAPSLSISSPTDGYTAQSGSVVINGSVSPSDSKVTVNSYIPVNVRADGVFQITAPLKSKLNTLIIQAENGDRQTVTSINVTRVFTEQELADKAKQDEEAKKAQEAQAQATLKTQMAYDSSPAGRICKKHPDWSKDTCQTISEGKVQVGMTSEQARASWGTPEDINRTTSSYGTHEQWVYSGNYLYFENGILTSIQN